MGYQIKIEEIEDGVIDTVYASSAGQYENKRLIIRNTFSVYPLGYVIVAVSFVVKNKGEIIFTTDHFIQAVNKFNSI